MTEPGVNLLAGLRNGKWLDAQNFPPLRYAVPGLVPEGLTLLVGPPKAGKSWAVLDIALAVASGGRALGAVPVGLPRPVFYLALEDGDRRLQERCRALLKQDPIPEDLDYLTDMQPTAALATIDAWLQYRQPGDGALIILDTLGKIMPQAAPGESPYQRDYRVGSALKRVADANPGTAVVVVHHDRKAASEDFVDSVSGTHGLAGAADTVAVLARPRGESSGLLKITGRDVTEAEYAVDLSAGASWVIVGGDLDKAAQEAVSRKAAVGLGDRSAEVLRAVAAGTEPMSPSMLAQVLGDIDNRQAAVYLGRLAESGRIRKVGRGRYTPVVSVVSVENEGDELPDTTLSTHTTGGTERTLYAVPASSSAEKSCDQCGDSPTRIDRAGSRYCRTCAPHLWRSA